VLLLFAVLVLSTAAIVGVALAIHFHVKRHLRAEQTEAQLHSTAEQRAEEEKTP
jgi:hypothetical protein